jgi:hypothetical protein
MLTKKNALSFAIVLLMAVVISFIYSRFKTLSLENLPYLQFETFENRKAYRVDPYILAAQHLQKIGKEAACNELIALSHSSRIKPYDIDDTAKIAVLCRMVFDTRNNSTFRTAGIGMPSLLGGTDRSDWPLEPIEIIDGVPFDITKGYALYGSGESPEEYVRYCITNCIWSATHYEPKTDTQKRTALSRLLGLTKWCTPLTQQERDSLSGQIQ